MRESGGARAIEDLRFFRRQDRYLAGSGMGVDWRGSTKISEGWRDLAEIGGITGWRRFGWEGVPVLEGWGGDWSTWEHAGGSRDGRGVVMALARWRGSRFSRRERGPAERRAGPP